MSHENVEAVREAIEGWNRGGFEGMRHFIHGDAVIRPFEEWPDDEVYHGVEGFEKLARQWTEQFEDITWQVERLEALDADRVLALVDHGGKTKGTGVSMSAPLGLLVRDFRSGRTAASIQFFLGWDKALQAAGL